MAAARDIDNEGCGRKMGGFLCYTGGERSVEGVGGRWPSCLTPTSCCIGIESFKQEGTAAINTSIHINMFLVILPP